MPCSHIQGPQEELSWKSGVSTPVPRMDSLLWTPGKLCPPVSPGPPPVQTHCFLLRQEVKSHSQEVLLMQRVTFWWGLWGRKGCGHCDWRGLRISEEKHLLSGTHSRRPEGQTMKNSKERWTNCSQHKHCTPPSPTSPFKQKRVQVLQRSLVFAEISGALTSPAWWPPPLSPRGPLEGQPGTRLCHSQARQSLPRRPLQTPASNYRDQRPPPMFCSPNRQWADLLGRPGAPSESAERNHTYGGVFHQQAPQEHPSNHHPTVHPAGPSSTHRHTDTKTHMPLWGPGLLCPHSALGQVPITQGVWTYFPILLLFSKGLFESPLWISLLTPERPFYFSAGKFIIK